MSIYFDGKQQLFVLQTKNTCYQMRVDETGLLRHVYYGRSVGRGSMTYMEKACDRGFSGNPYDFRENRGCSADVMPQEYSTFGAGDYRPSALRTVLGNGSRTAELHYAGHTIREGKYALDGLPCGRDEADGTVDSLIVELKDSVSGLSVFLSYGVYEEKDVITRTARIYNGSEQSVQLEKAASMSLDFPYGTYDLIHFSGRHCGERRPERNALTRCTFTVESKRGMSSHHANPFIILCDHGASQNHGGCYGFMLMYSGSHKEEVSVDQTGSVRLVCGIHDEGFCWNLMPGESFQTPETILSFSADGLNGLSGKYHRFVRENVADRRFAERKLPVLLNSWEACYFDFNMEKLLALADEGAALGMELFVLDDGWFGERNDDHRGLGDWTVNEKKLPGGLKRLSEEIHARGMSFGLWVEPEMVNEDSDLYRAHPDWALQDPGRKPVVARSQLVLDMSREDVQDYLFEAIRAILREAEIEYIKWDFNRSVSNVWSAALPPQRQGETAHRFVLGTYRLLSRLREAFPDLLIEGCAGGGGRFDAGMLYYCPQIWCSDNTDALARLDIQNGTSYGYPACTMGSHVSASPNHQTGRTMPLATRGITAMAGAFGYELNPGNLTDEEKAAVREQIAMYHRFERLIRQGDYFRLTEDTRPYTGWEFVSPDRREALVSIVITELEANSGFPYLKLQGLDPEKLYTAECCGGALFGADGPLTGAQGPFSGAALMYGGYVFDVMLGDFPGCQVYFREADSPEALKD